MVFSFSEGWGTGVGGQVYVCETAWSRGDCPVAEVEVLRRVELRTGLCGAATDGEGGRVSECGFAVLGVHRFRVMG